jgi:hypothetical protein
MFKVQIDVDCGGRLSGTQTAKGPEQHIITVARKGNQ